MQPHESQMYIHTHTYTHTFLCPCSTGALRKALVYACVPLLPFHCTHHVRLNDMPNVAASLQTRATHTAKNPSHLHTHMHTHGCLLIQVTCSLRFSGACFISSELASTSSYVNWKLARLVCMLSCTVRQCVCVTRARTCVCACACACACCTSM